MRDRLGGASARLPGAGCCGGALLVADQTRLGWASRVVLGIRLDTVAAVADGAVLVGVSLDGMRGGRAQLVVLHCADRHRRRGQWDEDCGGCLGRRQSRDGCLLEGGKPDNAQGQQQPGYHRERHEDAFAAAHPFGRRRWPGSAGQQLLQLRPVLCFHLMPCHLPGEHRLVEHLDVHAVEVPHEDGQHGQDRLGAMRGFCGRDNLAGQEFGGGDRVPEHEAGDAHDDAAPDHCPIFGLLCEVVARQLGVLLGQTQVVTHHIDGIDDIAQAWQHGQFDTPHEDPVGQDGKVVDALQREGQRGNAMDDARRLDAAEQPDEPLGDRVAAELLDQAGEAQERE